eukprot:TRINITY_DN13336_c0_g1_i2.p1 TRINITY_DN13336_c0_g1~~TRINITY_DN13336_c0_g1_i2.p1  ORF type:complete len:171 (-),score=15.57 TRINITY_DN13336_c0_g1_i2:175-687(-)
MIIGTGVFNLPHAFVASGLVLGTIVLVVSSVFAWLCLIWFIEVMARTEGITTRREALGCAGLQESGMGSVPPHHEILWRKFDLATLCDTFFGIKGKFFCQVCLSLFCLGILWAYASVFASSVSSLFFQIVEQSNCDTYNHPGYWCERSYYICLAIYAAIVVPLACFVCER